MARSRAPGEVDEQDAVLGDETHEHDDADHRHEVDASLRDEQREGDSEKLRGSASMMAAGWKNDPNSDARKPL